ncbi:cilia- and flagella-associated protein 65-like isoform X1 [Pieris brassicae]|uniref:cilia- and flagella-associated protein 65-like isoform X1 n=2 Tax=Pieris brassicae TaxID=7116 RepID=UPI001E65F854|nr:cilia- and flagella-associated protein 65-like isoform X1 [Pieris brassicae]
MQNTSLESIPDSRTVDFGCVPLDSKLEKFITIQNTSSKALTYRISHMYIQNNVDRVFKVAITTKPVESLSSAEVTVTFKPNVPGQSFTDYYLIDDILGNLYRLTVTGKCFGPDVNLNRRKLVFRICKNVTEQRTDTISIINKSSIDAPYQWLLPTTGQGYFQISTGDCGVIRAFETITATVTFSGMALGIYTAEIVCLVLNQEPLFLNVIAAVVLPGNPLYNINDHVFEKGWKRKRRSVHLMENSLNRPTHIPAASVYETYLDFGTGSVKDISLNISQTLCMTNHQVDDAYMTWLLDPDNVFLIDPLESIIPPNESRLFTIRFRPNYENEAYGFLLCGDCQHKVYSENSEVKIKHSWFRIPCVGNTLAPCTEWITEWDCPTEVVLPPTVPGRTSFANFMLSNKYDTPMQFKFEAPNETNYVLIPMCGIVQGRGWQIITVALEPKSFGQYCETWDVVINKYQKARLCLFGNAETSDVEVISHGYNPATHAMFEFQPTITGCTNYCTAYFHNLTRMSVHMRILNSVSWLGADNNGMIVLSPKEILRYHWWFFPKKHDNVYETTVTCSCICLIDDRPVGEPTEIFIHISGFSELPDLRVLPKNLNLHDAVVGDSVPFIITLYNYGSCYFTSKLYHVTDGMGDDYSGDKFEIDSAVNSLKPSNHCEVKMVVTANGSGPRQVDVKYTVLFRTEFDEVQELQPITKTICIVWYDGIYPTIKIKRTISAKCPVLLSNHCVWNIVNVKELNRALEDCRPNKTMNVNLYGPDLCLRPDPIEFIFVMGCVYNVPVPWSLKREKICDCEMVEFQVGISTYVMRHTCIHRPLVELTPDNGIVSPEYPELLRLKLYYTLEGKNTLCYVLRMPNQRIINIFIHIYTHSKSKGVLAPLRRNTENNEYLTILDCGRVPINNLDPVIRILWLYNPTDVFTTWRLLRGNTTSPDTVIRCLQYFAEVPPLDKLAIPFAFLPSEMIDYEMTFYCSFGYDIVKILVKGEGGLPNCIETRLDIPSYVEQKVRAAYTDDVVYLSKDHITLPVLPTHSLSRDILAINNDTDHVLRFIWMPERIANIVNVVMTPWWGVLQPKTSEWITMTVYTLQEPATFTTTISCEVLDLTERRRYQRNELLRRNKTEKCNQEFIITEEGTFHPGINDFPPYVLDLKKPQPTYLSFTVSVCSKGQRDGVPKMIIKQMWEKTPPYDLQSSDFNDYGFSGSGTSGNNMTVSDIIRIIDGILWDAMHCKMFKYHLKYYSKEDIPTYGQVKIMDSDSKPDLSRRVTSGICDAIVNKAVFHVYVLNTKHEVSILEAE